MLKKTVLANRRVAIREMAGDLLSLVGPLNSFWLMFSLISIWSVSLQFSWQKNLTLLQKRGWEDVTEEMLDNVADDPSFIKRITISDEMWAYEYDIRTI